MPTTTIRSRKRSGPRRVVVTGGSGFIGRHLVDRLLTEGREVTVVDIAPAAEPRMGKARFVNASVLDASAMREAMHGAEAVVHLAARVATYGRARDFDRLNVDGTRVVADAALAAGASRFVLMSSLAVFDYRRGFRDAPEAEPSGGHVFHYGRTKRIAERLVRAMQDDGFETVVLRPGLLPFGPGDRAGTTELLQKIERRETMLVGDGRAVLSTSYVGNLVDAIVLSLDRPLRGGAVLNVGDDLPITWRDFVGEAAKALQVEPNLASVPRWVAASGAAVLDPLWRALAPDAAPPVSRYTVRTVTSDVHFSNQTARGLLGFVPRFDLAAGLRATVAWYRGATLENAARARASERLPPSSGDRTSDASG